ncbi:Protein FAM163B [Lamprotornis superbus]|uniref:Protein FAM163B n=1 Tax=Lamprotornis superbus TaxID=245042 RepID=A0A835NYC1_9PASS|nr:Protein FAM163B [Lamprotornis superbus]
MTAGTVVITGGILATVILLCIIAVLCYCRLQYYCCKKDESEEDEEEPDFAVHSHIPPLHCNRNEPPTFFLQEPPEDLHNGGDRVSYKTVSQEDLALPVSNLQALNPNRLSAMREAFSRSRSISTDV